MERTPWLLDHKHCPRAIKVKAIQEFCKAYHTTRLSLKAKGKNPTAFQMHYHSRNYKKADSCHSNLWWSRESIWLVRIRRCAAFEMTSHWSAETKEKERL